MTDEQSLRQALVTSGLAGEVATAPASTLHNCARLVQGDEHCTFGLSDWRDATVREAVEAIRALCGGDPGGAADPDGPGYIDPDAAVRGIRRHREVLAGVAADGGARVLVATGHPTGLLAHYTGLARALQAAGCELLTPLDDVGLGWGDDGRRRLLRYLDGVAVLCDGASLRHTHRARYLTAALEACDRSPELVIGDHGMAGAAIEGGIPTLSIADVNDPGLPLAAHRGRTDGVLPLDDNLAPRHYLPVTAAMLGWD